MPDLVNAGARLRTTKHRSERLQAGDGVVRDLRRVVGHNPVASITAAELAMRKHPELATDAAEFLRELGAMWSQEFGAEVKMRCASLTTWNSESPVTAWAEFECAEHGRARLEIDAALVAAILELVAGSPGMRPLVRLTKVEEAALAVLILSALSVFRRSPLLEGQFAPRLVGIGFGHCQIAFSGLACTATIQVGECRGTARAVLPQTWLMARLTLLPAARRGELAPTVRAVEVDGAPCVQVAQVSSGEASVLGAGDVIFMTSAMHLFRAAPSDAGPSTGRLLFEWFQLNGTIAAFGRRSERGEIGFEVTGSQGGPMPVPVDAVMPLTVEVELAKVAVSLGTLSDLKLGTVLPLPLPIPALLGVRIAGSLFARGEIVEVDGELGVRLVELL